MTDFVPETCFKCGVIFGMPRVLHATCKRDRQTFYCPNGHGQAYTDSEADQLRRERDRLKQENARLEEARQRAWTAESAAREQARRQVAAAKGQITRLKNRAAAGVCPCCSRTFVNLQRHMATKHAGFVAEEIVLPEGAALQ